jgi:hypothetical protein
MTESESVTVRVVDVLDACKIPYFLSGSFGFHVMVSPGSQSIIQKPAQA